MAHRCFLRIRQLGEAATERRVEEQRIVAESCHSPRRVEDHALDRTRDHVFPSARLRHCDHAAKPGGTLFGGNIAKSIEQSPASGAVVESGTTEARGTHPGQAAQGIDLDPRVVRQGEPPAESGRRSRFQQGIPSIRFLRFLGKRRAADVAEQPDVEW